LFRKSPAPGDKETMSVESLVPGNPDSRECFAQVERVLSSTLLQRSETLCGLLRYLAERTLNSPADHLKEYQIATEAMGRTLDFDPQSDASVRVQTGRLRSKLAEYYGSAGIHDPILIDLPKGSYTLSFVRRDFPPKLLTPAIGAISAPVEPTAPSKNQQVTVLALSILASIIASGAAVYLFDHKTASSSTMKAASERLPAALQTFWNPFLHGPDEPIVVFSNAVFVGDAETGLRYFEASRDARSQTIEHYTGVGELAGVLELDRIFQKSGGQFRIKRGGLFTFDDARSNNLIFVGSPMENLTLRQFPTTQEFVFRRVPVGENRWNEVIVDLHPRPGETAIYPPGAKQEAGNADYAVIALVPSLDRSRWTLILAGLTTISTQAAVDYVCNERSMEELLHRMNVSIGGNLKPFEAVLKVKIVNDEPLQTQLIDWRPTDH
jgi:hypothetical protein